MDIKSLHLARMRSFISVVSQEPILFNCSIRDNIAYGLENEAGMDDVIEAARSANIHEFITGLPMVYIHFQTLHASPLMSRFLCTLVINPNHYKSYCSMFSHQPLPMSQIIPYKFSCKNIEIKKTTYSSEQKYI